MATSGRKGVKRLRSEAGVSAPSKKPSGEMYEKWKKKSRREIGVLDESPDNYDNRPKPNFKYNSHVKDEIKSADAIRKVHKVREKNRIKNMSKEKRQHVRQKMRGNDDGSRSKSDGRDHSRSSSKDGAKGRGGAKGRDGAKGRGGRSFRGR